MTAAEHLAQYNVTVAEAKAFILANLNNPSHIFNTSITYGVTAEMLAEIYGGVTADDVVGFFNNHGLNGNQLVPSEPVATLQHEDLAFMMAGLTFNELTDISLETLKDNVINGFELESDIFHLIGGDPLVTGYNGGSTFVEGVGEELYYSFFNPEKFIGAEDGVFSAEDLSTDHLGSIEATTENIELLLFSTQVNALKNTSVSEETELHSHPRHSMQDVSAEATIEYAELWTEINTTVTADPARNLAEIEYFTNLAVVSQVEYFGYLEEQVSMLRVATEWLVI